MKTALLVILLSAAPAMADQIFLDAGECVTVGPDTVCARDNGKPMHIVNKPRFPKHSRCSCQYGFRPVQNSGDPMKGFWLVRADLDGTELNIKNFGADEDECNQATHEHQLCK